MSNDCSFVVSRICDKRGHVKWIRCCRCEGAVAARKRLDVDEMERTFAVAAKPPRKDARTSTAGEGSCGSCRHFRYDPAYLEAAIPGLSSLSSATASGRADDGLRLHRHRYLSARFLRALRRGFKGETGGRVDLARRR
jgi:hypothetical protein